MTMTDLPASTSWSSRPSSCSNVGEVQSGRRLVENVDPALVAHVRSQLDPLALSAGQRRERLAETEVTEPDVGEPFEDGVRRRRCGLAGTEERLSLRHGHREHLTDVASTELVLQD